MSAHRSPAIALMLTLGLVLGCSSEPGAPSPPPPPAPAPTPVSTVTVNAGPGQILVGGTIQFSATLRDAAGGTLTGRVVTWASSDNSVAAVSSGGMVTGVGPGSATISAEAETKQGNATITVLAPVETVTIAPSQGQIIVGQTTQLAATLTDAAGDTLTGRTVSWTTSDNGVAAVSLTGLVIGTDSGAATITATAEGKQGIADITVLLPASAPVPSGIVSWWPAEGDASDIVSGNTGSLQGSAGFAPGKVGQAFSLNGTSAFIGIGNPASLELSQGDFTVEAWVWFSSLTPLLSSSLPHGDMSIVDKMSPTSINRDGWRLLKQSDNRIWFCFGRDTSNGCVPGGPTTVMSSTTVTTGTWYHVAAVKEGTTISIFMNGVLDASAPLGTFLDNHAVMDIGRYGNQSAHFHGLIDEVSIYGRALTATEIAGIFGAGAAGKR